MSKVLLALGLFLLAPLVAEFLLGNLPVTALASLLLLAPLYGGGALLIRETVRRAGRGWPSIVLLALAYGVIEEGIATMSLFNPNYAGLRLLDHGFVPVLGIGIPWTLFVLTLHTLWSISVPIALMETFARERATTPWLGRIGLGVTLLVFVAGLAGVTAFSMASSGFVAAPWQLAATLVVAVGLALLAFSLPRRRQADALAGQAPSFWLVGLLALAATSAFKELPWQAIPVWLYVAVLLVLALAAWATTAYWSRQTGWGAEHRLALAAGATLTYAWTAFPEQPVLPAPPMVDLVGNVVFAIGAVGLLVGAAWVLHRERVAPAQAESARSTRRLDYLSDRGQPVTR